ncbi:tRNA delta(2)-isopentenylpyrophosphate transferase [Pasteurella multocida]|uniref:tRNA delta(2)-isopentenylpyrophosphate transferase n=1 Tax=Pasteurella multocida TaxID=747 RepID=UPI002CD3E57E|nr:tRNA delta(2)-isopentenylpyrophosphate transferase [Pasteurella multocida]MEB3499857.1 tRNA delta(2)-isopentenylpyrophosphate transferase [Pasteurella multocida]
MNSTNNKSTLSLKQQFKLWLEQEQKDDEMIAFATIPHILRRFDRRLAIIKGNQFEKRYLREWREAFRIDRKIDERLLNIKFFCNTGNYVEKDYFFV